MGKESGSDQITVFDGILAILDSMDLDIRLHDVERFDCGIRIYFDRFGKQMPDPYNNDIDSLKMEEFFVLRFSFDPPNWVLMRMTKFVTVRSSDYDFGWRTSAIERSQVSFANPKSVEVVKAWVTRQLK